jgi:long-chain fatty acid transport protein
VENQVENKIKFVVFVVAATKLLATSCLSNASGFALTEQSASGMGNAYAGAAATAEDASTIFFNPAGMSYLPDSQLVIAGHAIRPSADFTNNGSRSGVGTPMAGGGGGDAGSWSMIPNFYYEKAISDTIHLGVGVNSPFGLKTEYDSGWAGRYFALKSELTTININPSISFKASDALSLGAGISFQRAEAVLTNALDFGTICYGSVGSGVCNFLGLTPQNADGSASVKGSDWATGYNFGAILQPVQSTRIGIAYRSQIHHHLDGNITYGNVPASLSPFFINGSVSAKLDLPATFSASIAHQLNDKWELLADVTWTQWDTFRQLTISSGTGAPISNQPENWQNTMRYSIGASYRYSEDLKLRAGLAYDESPVPDAYRTPRIPDGNRTWLSLGAHYRLSSASSIDAGYSHLFVRNVPLNEGSVPSLTGQLIGSYSDDVNILSIQYTHDF